MVHPLRCQLPPHAIWKPSSYAQPKEARLDSFGPLVLPNHSAWPQLSSWWLKHTKGANTPNWDLVVSCDIDGTPGLILVEAKANVPELGVVGKPLSKRASRASHENHQHIRSAIIEARENLSKLLPTISIDRDKHYQLSNRIAFCWRLASLGIPVILIYLGFTGDEGIRYVGEPFADDEHWQRTFTSYLEKVCPPSAISSSIDVGPASFWILSRSRKVLEHSPQRD